MCQKAIVVPFVSDASMAFVGIKVPVEVGKVLAQIPVPGGKVDSSEYHMTLLHLGDSPPIAEISKSVFAAFGVSSQTRPFTVFLSKVETFPPSPDGNYPVIVPVNDPNLNAMRARLAAAFDRYNLFYSKKHPEFKGHITLAYSEKKPENSTFPEVAFTVSELVIWGGEETEDRIVIRLPLEMASPLAGVKVAARAQIAKDSIRM